jgi:hypothetical protein
MKNIISMNGSGYSKMERFMQGLDALFSVTAESFHALDMQGKQICHIKDDNLFLCGFSVEEALKPGYGFYPKVIAIGRPNLCHAT